VDGVTPSVWSQLLGLLLFTALVLGLRAGHRAVLRERVARAAARPLPGRTRDTAAGFLERRSAS
jgi:hypothetical protein